MSERRLSDEELDDAIRFCEQGMIDRPLLALRTNLGDGMSEALLGVLRELRALRLSPEDREALRFARAALMDDAANDDRDRFEARYEAASAVLDRLLSQGGEK